MDEKLVIGLVGSSGAGVLLGVVGATLLGVVAGAGAGDGVSTGAGVSTGVSTGVEVSTGAGAEVAGWEVTTTVKVRVLVDDRVVTASTVGVEVVWGRGIKVGSP